MKCPACLTSIKLDVRETQTYFLKTDQNTGKKGAEISPGYCPECNHLIVSIRFGDYRVIDGQGELISTESEEVLYPKTQNRCTANEVPEKYRNMFNEANSVVYLSPKASAALSRRLLQLLLRDEYSIQRKRDLSEEIDTFINRSDIPEQIKQVVDAIRNIGNFAAHPNKYTNTGEIVDVEPGEADWLLEILECIFDHKFIEPARTIERKNRLNNKLQALNRNPMK